MKKIVLPDRGAEVLFDMYDQNVRYLESLFDVQISARGSNVLIEGETHDVEALTKLLTDFSTLVDRGEKFQNGDLRTAFKQIAENSALTLHDFFPKRQILGPGGRQVSPKSPNQRKYIEVIQRHDIVFAVGPAGTGKTYLAVAMAVSYLLNKRVERIILARPAVEAGERLGFLPGDLQEKVNPYLRPLYDALYHMMDAEKVNKLLERQIIEIAPLAFMRGRTLSDAFIILDEAQNTSPEQMKMFLTRIGINSKAVITGDVTQVDLPVGKKSGLIEAIRILREVAGLAFCHFDERDVVRHELVQLIIKAYERESRSPLESPSGAASSGVDSSFGAESAKTNNPTPDEESSS
ncbi:MAG TPA: PhoH family protein [Acidobacteriota bacterium]|jgi:phosphate starvation-inducible PhoH-like protein|nr:PhoH family protein [Acidobacteriota bacterium]